MTTGFPNLSKLGFTDFLKEPVNFTKVQDVTKINIGTVLELNQLKEFFNYSNNELLTWLLQLNSESGDISAANKDTRLRTAKLVSNYKQKYTQLNKSKQALDEFLCTQCCHLHVILENGQNQNLTAVNIQWVLKQANLKKNPEKKIM